MSETVERAHETIEEHAHHTDPWARNVAILVSVLAAALAITEIGGNAAQNAYLAQHVELSNNWAFFQSKNVRAVVLESQAEVLASLPNADDPAIQARIKDSKDARGPHAGRPARRGRHETALGSRPRPGSGAGGVLSSLPQIRIRHRRAADRDRPGVRFFGNSDARPDLRQPPPSEPPPSPRRSASLRICFDHPAASAFPAIRRNSAASASRPGSVSQAAGTSNASASWLL